MGISLPIKGGRGTLSDTTDSFGKKWSHADPQNASSEGYTVQEQKERSGTYVVFITQGKKTWEKSML